MIGNKSKEVVEEIEGRIREIEIKEISEIRRNIEEIEIIRRRENIKVIGSNLEIKMTIDRIKTFRETIENLETKTMKGRATNK